MFGEAYENKQVRDILEIVTICIDKRRTARLKLASADFKCNRYIRALINRSYDFI